MDAVTFRLLLDCAASNHLKINKFPKEDLTLVVTLIGVVGAGQMGADIAQVCAVAGYNIVLNDVSAPALEGALKLIERSPDTHRDDHAFIKAGTIGFSH
jgi:predicted homoserine dehydrogenase-like protein